METTALRDEVPYSHYGSQGFSLTGHAAPHAHDSDGSFAVAAPEAHEQELCSSQGIEAALHVASGGRHCTLLQGGGSGEGKFFAPSFPHVFAMVSILALLLPNQPSRPSPPLACVSHA